MRIILRTMDLPGKSAALYRPRKSPITCTIRVMSQSHKAIYRRQPVPGNLQEEHFNKVFEKELISHTKTLQARSLLLGIWKHTCVPQGCFFWHYSLTTSINNHGTGTPMLKPIESKCSPICYLMHFMLGYIKWEYWSLTITKRVQCL